MKTPKSIEHHQADYKEGTWQQFIELIEEKIEEDLHAAQDYLNMMQSHIDEAKKTLYLER